MLRHLGAVATLTIILGLGLVPAAHADGVECPPGSTDVRGICTVTVTEPGTGGGGAGAGGGASEAGSGSGSQQCTWQGATIPCKTDDGAWNGNCYVQVTDPQPPKSDPVWDGHTDGVIVTCTNTIGTGQFGGGEKWQYWAAGPPDAAPDPRVLAQTAVSKMNLVAGDIGITPPTSTGAMGIVGIPTWLWVSDPSASTTGPITTTASAGGTTVTATGRLDRIVWSLGNGHSITCQGAGTAYAASYGSQSSPDCGYTYTETSGTQPGNAYTITATSYWTITWTGGGETGTIPLDFSRSVQHKVGEVQVLVTKGDQ